MPSIILPITPFYFPKPQWRRTAATKPVVSTQPLPTIDELAKMVESRLHVHDSTQGLSAASPFFETPFTFRAPRAPLPSLVTRKVSVAPVQPTTAVNTTNARRSKGSKGANASKQLAAAAGPSTSLTSSRKEKKPSLPRRTPKRAPKRNPSPALSDSSSRSASSSPLSRTPSLEFSFSPSRITSTATTAGSPPSRPSSIGPTTPIDTTVSLPFVAGADFREVAFDPMFGNPVFPTDVVVAKPPLNLPPPLPSSLALPAP